MSINYKHQGYLFVEFTSTNNTHLYIGGSFMAYRPEIKSLFNNNRRVTNNKEDEH